MTDKQIIIDGVDVSECEFYIDSKNLEYNCKQTPQSYFCKNKPNCYYKQLKRKEQSEAKLAKQIQTICDFINNRPEIFKGIYGSVDKIITEYAERKEQECFELQKTANAYNYLVKLANYRLDKIEDLQQQLDQLKAENEILKEKLVISSNSDKKTLKIIQTLTEIKEIAETAAKCLYATESDDYTDGYRWLGSIILQKISECEVK